MSYQSSLVKHDFKDKIIENFKIATAGHEAQVQGPVAAPAHSHRLVLPAVKDGGERHTATGWSCQQSRTVGTAGTCLSRLPVFTPAQDPFGVNSPMHSPFGNTVSTYPKPSNSPESQAGPGLSPLSQEGETEAQRGKCFTQNMIEGKRQGWLSNPNFQALGPALPRYVPNFPTLSDALHIPCLSRRRGL